MRDEWLHEVFQSIESLQGIGYQLQSLAQAFYRTGNDRVSEDLQFFSTAILEHTKAFRDLVGEEIHDGHRQAQEMSATVLKAALAGCLLGRKDK